MITIIPDIEVLNAVTIKGCSHSDVENLRKSFTEATSLITESSTVVLLTSQIWDKILPRLNSDHRRFFEDTYYIDNSTRGLSGYDIHKAIQYVSGVESKASRYVLILCRDVDSYAFIPDVDKIKKISAADFLKRVNILRTFNKKIDISSMDALLKFVFFGQLESSMLKIK